MRLNPAIMSFGKDVNLFKTDHILIMSKTVSFGTDFGDCAVRSS